MTYSLPGSLPTRMDHTTRSAGNQSLNTPLLALPLEIRHQIYTHYLTYQPLNLHHWGPQHQHLLLTNPFHLLHSICQQIHAELIALGPSPYSHSQANTTIILNPWRLRKAQAARRRIDSSLGLPQPFTNVRHLVFTGVFFYSRSSPNLQQCRNLRTITIRSHEHSARHNRGLGWWGPWSSKKPEPAWPNDAVHLMHVIIDIHTHAGLRRRVVGVRADVVGTVHTKNIYMVRDTKDEAEGSLRPPESMFGALLAVVSFYSDLASKYNQQCAVDLV